MKPNTDHTMVVFAAVGLILALMMVAPDEVQNQLISGVMSLMLFEVWMRGRNARP